MPVYYGRLQQIVNRSVDYRDPAEARDPDLRAFFALWDAARRGRQMPVRADIDFKSMRKHLPMVQLYDVLEGGADFHFRVSGTQVFLVNGVDMTGKTVSAHPNAAIRSRLLDVLRHVVATAKAIYARFESVEAHKVHHQVVESVYLPLGDGAVPTQIIGLTVFSAER